MHRRAWLVLGFALLFLTVAKPARGQIQGWIRLDSGDSLAILGLARFTIPRDSAVLALDYETRLSLTDTASLRREVLKIWPTLRKLAEDQHFWAAAIRANRAEGPATQATVHAYGFVFQRRPEGGWHFLNDTTTIE